MDAHSWPEEYFGSSKSVSDFSSRLFEVFSSATESSNSKERAILEFISQILTGKTDSSIAVDAVKSLVNTSLKGSEFEVLKSQFIQTIENALWFWSTQTTYEAASPSEQWKKLAVLTSKFFSCDFFDAASAKLVLPTDLLIYSLNLPDKDEDLNKKFVKIRTRLYFRQEKFNILREETEGYAKLLSVLSTLPAPPADPTAQTKLVFSAIGQFDLDPNRVVDLGIFKPK
jgi:hypothetical protein